MLKLSAQTLRLAMVLALITLVFINTAHPVIKHALSQDDSLVEAVISADDASDNSGFNYGLSLLGPDTEKVINASTGNLAVTFFSPNSSALHLQDRHETQLPLSFLVSLLC